MDKEDRVGLIRRGNELFNKGDFKNALKIFLATNYKDGIARVADHLYYDKKDQVSAIKLYKKAGYTKIIAEFAERAAVAVRMWLKEDTLPTGDLSEIKPSAKEFGIKKWEPITLKKEEIIDAGMRDIDLDKIIKKKKKENKSGGK